MEPELPYGGDTHPNSGHAGSETSQQRAIREDSQGTTANRQAITTTHLQRRGLLGTTYIELGLRYGWGHQVTSAVLSVLHKAGRVNRLTEVRNGCKVYVLPGYVNGRDTEPHGQTATTELLADAINVLRSLPLCRHVPSVVPDVNCSTCNARAVIRRYESTRK